LVTYILSTPPRVGSVNAIRLRRYIRDQEPGPGTRTRDRAPGKGKQLHRKITQSPASSTDQHQEPGTVNRETENNQGGGQKETSSRLG